jgi:hypothetical protein
MTAIAQKRMWKVKICAINAEERRMYNVSGGNKAPKNILNVQCVSL